VSWFRVHLVVVGNPTYNQPHGVVFGWGFLCSLSLSPHPHLLKKTPPGGGVNPIHPNPNPHQGGCTTGFTITTNNYFLTWPRSFSQFAFLSPASPVCSPLNFLHEFPFFNFHSPTKDKYVFFFFLFDRTLFCLTCFRVFPKRPKLVAPVAIAVESYLCDPTPPCQFPGGQIGRLSPPPFFVMGSHCDLARPGPFNSKV